MGGIGMTVDCSLYSCGHETPPWAPWELEFFWQDFRIDPRPFIDIMNVSYRKTLQ